VPPREWLFRIQDIVDAIERVLDYTRGMDVSTFEGERETVDAVLFNFVIIGEAATHVPPEVATKYPEIDWRHMSGMRNRLVHEYFGADPKIVWHTVEDDLPAVLPRLRAILVDADEPDDVSR
jgi:uncharacterized protein with HEPN domain